MSNQSESYEAALEDLKAKVTELMDDAKRVALEKIDKLQLEGTDIVGDHITNGEQAWITPRLFINAYADEMKNNIG